MGWSKVLVRKLQEKGVDGVLMSDDDARRRFESSR